MFGGLKRILRRAAWSVLYRGRRAEFLSRILRRTRHLERLGPIQLPLSVSGRQEPVPFTLYYFGSYESGHDYLVLSPGDFSSLNQPLLRISSSCIWAFALASVRCDCRWEFEEAKRRAVNEPDGNALLIFAASQHGKGVPGGIRGHALIYSLGQAASEDLVYAAYQNNGFRLDYRSYDDVAKILADLEICSVRLLTNSPGRLRALRRDNLEVTHVPLEKPYEVWDSEELGVKRARYGHILALEGFDPADIFRYGLDPESVFGSGKSNPGAGDPR